MQLFVASIYDQMEEELSNRLRQPDTQENIECSKYQLIFVTAEEVLTAEKMYCLTVSLIVSTWFLFFIFYQFFFVIGKYFRSLN